MLFIVPMLPFLYMLLVCRCSVFFATLSRCGHLVRGRGTYFDLSGDEKY